MHPLRFVFLQKFVCDYAVVPVSFFMFQLFSSMFYLPFKCLTFCTNSLPIKEVMTI